jgi:hypothetical protein
VAGAGNANGGSVTFTSGNIPASGETVLLRRAVPQTQAIDYIANDPFPAESHEEGLDRAMMTTQQIQEELDRAIKLSRTNTMTSTEFTTSASDRASKILAFDSSGELSVTQELGTFKGTDATVTTAAYVQRDIIKSTTAAQLNNVYICVADSVVGDSLTDTDHFELLVDAVSAATSATNAATSATTATTKASEAATSATNASTSATTATTKASEASTSATSAASSAAAAAASADSFDDTYLGAKSSDPTVDNDGDALTAGDLYFNTTSDQLKYYTGSAWVAIAPGIANVSEDTTPQLGGNLDTNSHNIDIDNAHGIRDENGNEQIIFQTTASAVNQLDITNAATGNAPEISATGGDTNIDLKLTPKGSGKLNLDGIKFPNADGSADQVLKTDGSGNLSFTDVSGGTSWQAVKTSDFTAVAGEGYAVDTSSGVVDVTFPSSANTGDTIVLLDYARNFHNNKLTIDPNGLNFQGAQTPVPEYNTEGQSITCVYIDSTKGWIPTVDDDVTYETPQTLSVDFLIVAGGGGINGTSNNWAGGGGAGGYRNSFNNETSGGGGSSETAATFTKGQTYTITVGAGGVMTASGSTGAAENGGDSSISGLNVSLTSLGGGESATSSSTQNVANTGGSGGSGGGGTGQSSTGGSGTANQGHNGGSSNFYQNGGGGGGAGAAGANSIATTGGNGGAGVSSSISGSAVTRGGGGAGSGQGTAGTGGSGGGGNATTGVGNSGNDGGTNLGGGGGGSNGGTNGKGGSGVVILRTATANFSSVSVTGSPTSSTSGSDTIHVFNGSGSIVYN